jgi:DNA polymerase elongation subunit (family B)
MEPKRKGILRGVHVCDFSRLYPSVIMTFNLSPETIRGHATKKKKPSYLSHEPDEYECEQGEIVTPMTHVRVVQEPRGVLPIAVEEMLRLRKVWDKRKAECPPGTDEWKDADRRSTAYKIAVNSFYGVVSSPHSRFYMREVGESTSLGGVWLIDATLKEAEKQGFEYVYGDTDSGFVVGHTNEEFSKFVDWCNKEFYPSLIKSTGASRNFISLAYEKKFQRIVFVSKKRYAGSFEHFKGTMANADSEPEIKGLEYRRGDTCRLARQFQYDAICMILKKCIDDPAEFEKLVLQYRDIALKNKLDLDDVFISKRIAKPLREYVIRQKDNGEDAADIVHVHVAKELEKRGQKIGKGTKISFVVTDGTPGSPLTAIPAEDFAGECDRFYLWENLVYPPTMRLLQSAFPDVDWTRFERVRPSKKARVSPNQMKLIEV